MEREEFARRLQAATDEVLAMTRRIVAEVLPATNLYLISPNGLYNGDTPEFDYEQFPEDTLPLGQVHQPPLDGARVVDYLWRHGKVPGHIKIQIVKADGDCTFFFLRCSCMFTSGSYHPHWAGTVAPFQSLGPRMPHTWMFLKISEQQREAWNPEIEAQYWERMIGLNGKITLGNKYLELLQQVAEKRRLAES